jgi:ribosomal protein S18 acetylase RimI-like enzyme
MSVEIISYTEGHFDDLDKLWRGVFPDDPPRNAARIVIPSKVAIQPDLLLIAVDGPQVVGSIMAGYDGHRGWINRLAVAASHRSQGIGTTLMQEAEKRLLAMGCAKINLQVIASNADVVGFYRRLGYAIEERISMGKQMGPF